jgi:hypothetical protein
VGANLPFLPITMPASIVNGSISVTRTYTNESSIYNGYPYEFEVDVDIIPEALSDNRTEPNPYVYDGFDIVPGMWFGQTTGLAYEIISVSNVTSTTATWIIRDVNLYNLLSDPSFGGSNYPLENQYGVVFSVSEDGTPIISALALQSGVLPESFYWVNDLYARFQYRNFVQSNYNFDNNSNVYGTYATGQVVYIGASGGNNIFIPVTSTIQSETEKSFGVVSSVNQPEAGNLTVRPFGKIIKTDFILPGAIGDVLYYDETNPPSYATPIKPANPFPLYIKINDLSASF